MKTKIEVNNRLYFWLSNVAKQNNVIVEQLIEQIIIERFGNYK